MSQTAAVRPGRDRTAFFTAHFVNPGVYLQGLSRLLVPGLALGIPTVLLSLLLSFWIADKRSMWLWVPMLLVTLLAPILCLSAFSFLRSRREADLTFAAPVTRTCLFVSTCLSVLTVYLALAAAVFLCTVLPRMGANLPMPRFGEFYGAAADRLALTLYVRVVLYMVCTGWLLCAAMTLSAALSGGVGHTLFLFLLLFLTPSAVRSAIAAHGERMPEEQILSIDRWALPLPGLTDMIGSCFAPSTRQTVLTLLFSVVVFAAAGLVFRFRRVESAGEPAAGRWVLRLTVCLLMLRMAVHICLDPSGTVGVVAEAVVLYFLYLLLTTRRLSPLWKCLPYAAGAAVVTALCVLGGWHLADAVRVRVPLDADRVEGFSCSTVGMPAGGFSFINTNTFSTCAFDMSDLMEIRDRDAVEKAVELINRDKELRAQKLGADADTIYITLFKKNGRRVQRAVRVSRDDLADFYADISEIWFAMYKELLITQPASRPQFIGIGYRSVGDTDGRWALEAHCRNIDVGSAFRTEYNALTEEQKRDMVMPLESVSESGQVISTNPSLMLTPDGTDGMRDMFIRFRYADDAGTDFELCFKLDPALMPETYRLICAERPFTEDFMAGKIDCRGITELMKKSELFIYCDSE